MTFSVKQYVADKQLTPFEFEDINGDKQTLPNVMLMTAGQADAYVAKMNLDPISALAEIAPDLADILRSTPVVAIQPLAEAYLAHCKGESGVGVGESEASPASSKSTARPSKRTSRATTPKTTRKR